MFYGFYRPSHAELDRANEARNRANTGARVQSLVAELEHRLERMGLLSQALWTILRERVGISEEELLAVAREVDLQDGRADGKLRQTAVECPECQRVIAKRRTRCIYCSCEVRRPPFGSI